MSQEDFSAREIAALRPRLREGLKFSLQDQGRRQVCVIEDPVAARFHRVGLAEYRFLRALNGTRTVAAILAQLAHEGSDAFSESEALHIIRWLGNQDLLAVESSRESAGDQAHRAQAMRAVSWLNPLICKIPLFRPDQFFAKWEPRVRWFMGKRGFVLWLAVLIVGAVVASMEWPRFVADADGIFSRDNWIWLFLAWAGLKIAHECGHGLYCKRYGAAVREAGVILVIFVPMGYIDATASLGLASRWRRMMVAAAGLYVEFFIAAIAVVVWALTAPGPVHSLAHNVVVIGTVVTLFFNANPLMRFDGYYILSDLLEVPNLATRGRAWFQRALTWLLLGRKAVPALRPSSREGWIAAVYGCLAAGWQVLVLAGLLLAASATMRGGGLLLAVFAGAMWIALPVTRFAETLWIAARRGAKFGVLVARVCILAALVTAVLFTPWHRSVLAEGVIEFADTEVLRAECPGFVAKEYVQDGESVAAGQLLVELSNDEAAAELAQRRIALTRQELRARLAYTRDDVAAFQAEQASIEALRKDVADRETFLATLQIRAPFAGCVTNRHLGKRRGSFVPAGTEIVRIGLAEKREVKLSISENDEPHFRAALGKPVETRIGSLSQILTGQLTRIEARATRQPAHLALTAIADGPLALRRVDENAERSGAGMQGYELAEPHFTATVETGAQAQTLSGEMARVRFRSSQTVTLWSELHSTFAGWLRRSIPMR